MPGVLEQVIEKMIGDGIITETELQQKIEEERKKSPVTYLRNDSEGIGQLISFLIQHDETMSQVLNLLLMRITHLENEVRELKTNG